MKKLTPLVLNEDFKYITDQLEHTDKNMFITGKAGTGKSTLLQYYRNFTKKKVVVLAPTGIAALNVGGQTIHSFFKFAPKLLSAKDIKKRRSLKKLFSKIEMLIIDEISMVRADLLDNIDRSLRVNRESYLPFGGVQVVFFGDMFQLPPVVSKEEEKNYLEVFYDSPYFFSAKVIKEIELEHIELQKIYRQSERHFIRLLEAVRLNRIDWEDLEDLNVRYKSHFENTENHITLAPRNAKVNAINSLELTKLDTPSLTYTAKVAGDFPNHIYPTSEILVLKEGAQVMFIRNDNEGQFVNGTIGKISSLRAESIKVEIKDDEGNIKEIEVQKTEWEQLKYDISEDRTEDIEAKTVGTFEQYPLKLAWAITIHKSQGKTFDKVIIDMGKGAFEHGQTYVALSRCRTLDGIVLLQNIKHKDIITDERIVDYYQAHF